MSVQEKEILIPENWTKQMKLSKLAFTCSKPTVETLEKGVKYVQS